MTRNRADDCTHPVLKAILALCDEADFGQQSYGSMVGKITTYQLRELLTQAGNQRKEASDETPRETQ
jgi:hypothetical protein